MEMKISTRTWPAIALLTCLTFLGGSAGAVDSVVTQDTVTFEDIAKKGGAGLAYRRIASPTKATWDELRKKGELKGVTSPELFALYPPKPFGAPGVVMFDFDNDGALDIFVTNGPGRPNSLFRNLFKDTGKLEFVDIAEQAGVTMTAQEKSGACFGDIDNDGLQDLYVLVLGAPNQLFRNLGKGKFLNVTALSATGGGDKHPTTCAFGDVNNDGLVDISVANSWSDWSHRLPLASFNYLEHAEGSQLFVNRNGAMFDDASTSSGLDNFKGIGWAIAMVDFDFDGNLDIVVANDQAMKRPHRWGGEDHGKLRLYKGNGKGHFDDITDAAGATSLAGDYMGIAFGDFNYDGRLDIFSTNMGNYGGRVQSIIPMVFWPGASGHGELASRWYNGAAGNKFTDPGVGKLGATPFGWGTSAFDYDNDGCTDLVFYGALNLGIYYDASNPGAILRSDCGGNFAWDEKALIKSSNHSRRAVEGLSTGDLNGDGFPDIVSVSGADWPEPFPLIPYPLAKTVGGVFEKRAFIWPTFMLIDQKDRSKGVRYTGMDPVEGSLSVELNSGNKNGWAKIHLLGGKGLTSAGTVNRGGVGAVLFFTPDGGKTSIRPYGGGGGYASNDAPEAIFGMAQAEKGRIDILWPGGNRTRLYDVRAGETLVIPELPCNMLQNRGSAKALQACVGRALADYEKRGLVSKKLSARLMASAVRASQGQSRDAQSKPIKTAQLEKTDLRSTQK
ncbi:MAG: hypothetical protein A3I66_04140 [Burkholderiales bacterium RIFCSPLOWO2_02_FULL_57_36]|nr:MAG: hypothetical protein A3I66_04140 [Burkholderiales bacterium RIFCSPLOWO2_02_FULL_57_36]